MTGKSTDRSHSVYRSHAVHSLIRVRQLDPAAAEAVRLDGPPGVHRLREHGGHRRVSGRLRAVGRTAPAGSTSGSRPPAPARATSTAGASGGAVTTSPPSSSAAHTTPMASCGTASRIALAEPVDVRRDPGQQIARAGPLQDARRQPDRPYEEVLAQVGQHPLAEHRAAQPHLPYEHGLDDQRDDEQRAVKLQMEFPRPSETRSTTSPSSYGPTMEATTATVLTVTRSRNARRCLRNSSAT